MKSHKLVIINLEHWSDTDTNIVKVNCCIWTGSIWIYESIDWIFNCRHCTFIGGLFKSLVLNVAWVGVCFILILSTTKTSIDIKNLLQLRLSSPHFACFWPKSGSMETSGHFQFRWTFNQYLISLGPPRRLTWTSTLSQANKGLF